MLHSNRQLSFSALCAKGFDEPGLKDVVKWINFPYPEQVIQWMHDAAQPHSRSWESLQEILSHRVLEMFTIQRNGQVEEVGWLVNFIWWHLALNFSNIEWDLMVYWLPQQTTVEKDKKNAYRNKKILAGLLGSNGVHLLFLSHLPSMAITGVCHWI